MKPVILPISRPLLRTAAPRARAMLLFSRGKRA